MRQFIIPDGVNLISVLGVLFLFVFSSGKYSFVSFLRLDNISCGLFANAMIFSHYFSMDCSLCVGLQCLIALHVR